jgi:hypothetical protein
MASWAGVKRVGQALLPWFNIGALVVVPILVAWFGSRIQQSVADQGVRKDYVQMAIGILSSRPISKDDPLRGWAIEILAKNSPVPLTLSAKKGLELALYQSYRPDQSQNRLVPAIGNHNKPDADRPPEITPYRNEK